jgi:cytochrome c biogenesis protein CcdA/thiol-disulfide isomerase/thioredoxin
MELNLINILLAFLEGFALIISPCILPILPLVLSASLTGSKARPIGIIAGFMTSFLVVVIFSRSLVQYAHLDPNLLRTIAFIVLLLLGVIMLSSYLSEKFTLLSQRLLAVGNNWQSANNTQGGFWSGFLFGSFVGVIWTPCAGPIFAAVIVQIAIQQTTINSILAIIAFAIGAGLPMLLIALIGRRIMANFSFFKTHAIWCRKILGVIIIASVVYIIYIDNAITAPSRLATNQTTDATTLINALPVSYPAPIITGIDAWINSPPLQLSQLKGKVVLIDFWTYSCINCIRTLPYLIDWYAKYHDKGFEIIGIHTPEFEFEKNLTNVKNAVKKFGIQYPVALDNRYATWLNFNNHYWPAHYLINQAGEVIYVHFGEGEYDVTENNIRQLLGIKAPVTAKNSENILTALTPETYLGYERAERMMSSETVVKNAPSEYSYPQQLPQNAWALQGQWQVYAEKVLAKSRGAAVQLHFKAKQVHAVMGAPTHPVRIKLRLNKQMMAKEIVVSNQQLYTLIDLEQVSEGTLEIIAQSPDLEIYTFTFG